MKVVIGGGSMDQNVTQAAHELLAFSLLRAVMKPENQGGSLDIQLRHFITGELRQNADAWGLGADEAIIREVENFLAEVLAATKTRFANPLPPALEATSNQMDLGFPPPTKLSRRPQPWPNGQTFGM